MASHHDLRELEEGLGTAQLTELIVGLAGDHPFARVRVLEEDSGRLLEAVGTVGRLLRSRLRLGEDFFQLTQYEPGYPNEENQLVFTNPESLAELRPMLNAIRNHGQLPSLGDIDFEWKDAKVEMRIVRVGRENLVLVRRIPRGNILAPGGKKKFFVLSRQGILQVQERSGISFDSTVDAFIWRDTMYFVHVSTIEGTFRLTEVLERNAVELVAAIQASVSIPGLETIVGMAHDNLPLLRKLRRISQQDYLPQLTVSRLEEVARANQLDIKFSGAGLQRSLQFGSSNRNDVLRLLDDDFLRSELTRRRYAVRDQAKKPITGS